MHTRLSAAMRFFLLSATAWAAPNGGNVASSLACETFTQNVKAELEKTKNETGKCLVTPEEAEIMLVKSVGLANQLVFNESFKEAPFREWAPHWWAR